MKYLDGLHDRSQKYADKYGLDGPIDGDADAFRHAYSSAEMTRDFGSQLAYRAGTWWEILGLLKGQGEEEAIMDLWNNYVGRKIAIRLGPSATNDELAEAVHDSLQKDELMRKPPKKPMKEYWEESKGWVQPRDPIILDLDGNGLQTVGLDSNIYFDHNGDGILTKTGWVGEGDALLVWDRNANGLIENGAELFGDFTPMPDGTLAPNGFAALAALDTNGDGVLDATDPAFAELKLWIDSDQNGVTGEGELISLAEAGIASLNLGNTLKNQKQGNGNTLAREGSFTRTDGTESAMGEFHLAVDTFDTQFADPIDVPESLRSLPMMNGSGSVRDLQQAATQSDSLQSLLYQFENSTDRFEQKALVDQILTDWANTSGMATSLDTRAQGEFRIQYEAFGNVRRSAHVVSSGAGAAAPNNSVSSGAGLASDSGNENLTAEYRALMSEWSNKLHVLEAFNGQYFFNLPDKKSLTPSANHGFNVVKPSSRLRSGSAAIVA